MKTRTKLLVGCISIPIAGIVLIVCVALFVLLAPVSGPQVRTERVEQTFRVPADSLGNRGGDYAIPKGSIELPADDQQSSEIRESFGPGVQAKKLIIVIEEGSFEIVPGTNPHTLEIEANYDTASYELTQEESTEYDGASRHEIRFGRKGFALMHLARMMRGGPVENKVEIKLPTEIPFDLEISASKGEARIDLSGLRLRSLTVDAGMGEVDVLFREENPEPMSELTVTASMGEVGVRGLGFAGAEVIDLHGSMGEFVFDFSGPWKHDASAHIRISMGDGRIEIPDDIDLTYSHKSVFLGDLHAPLPDPRPDDMELGSVRPHLELDLGVTMGSLVAR